TSAEPTRRDGRSRRGGPSTAGRCRAGRPAAALLVRHAARLALLAPGGDHLLAGGDEPGDVGVAGVRGEEHEGLPELVGGELAVAEGGPGLDPPGVDLAGRC